MSWDCQPSVASTWRHAKPYSVRELAKRARWQRAVIRCAEMTGPRPGVAPGDNRPSGTGRGWRQGAVHMGRWVESRSAAIGRSGAGPPPAENRNLQVRILPFPIMDTVRRVWLGDGSSVTLVQIQAVSLFSILKGVCGLPSPMRPV